MEILRISDTAIITTEKVTKSFTNVDCYLQGRIKFVTEDEVTGAQIYKVRTDLVFYEDYTKIITPYSAAIAEVRDENDAVIVEAVAEVQEVSELRQRLVLVEEKQGWSKQEVSVEDYNNFNLAIAPMIPNGTLPKQAEDLKMQLVFLTQRQADAPWGTGANWRTFDSTTELDILKLE